MTDLDLALTYIPNSTRALVAALFAVDSALGNVVRTTSEPMIGQIRLAWWRERMAEIDDGIVAVEPRLQALAEAIAASPLSGTMIAPLADFWVPVLDPFPWDDGEVQGWIARRGAELFGWAAIIVDPGCSAEDLRIAAVAGAYWAGMDVARHISDPDEREILRDVVLFDEDQWQERNVPLRLRPLTMLGLLAQRDARLYPSMEPEATPARAWAMLRHRLTGKIRI